MDVPQSIDAAWRCIASATIHAMAAERFPAFTPADEPYYHFECNGWPTLTFERNRYSRPLPCMSCFASHALLWQKCAEENRDLVVCEHDAFWIAPIPPSVRDGPWCVNLCKPSYGRWKQPTCGLSPMTHKPAPHYMGGATAYLVRPKAAREFLRLAKTEAEPVDVFLNLKRFPFLHDWFPFPAECRGRFTTIQNAAGCAAKHHQPVEII